jgi:hypothetical protein
MVCVRRILPVSKNCAETITITELPESCILPLVTSPSPIRATGIEITVHQLWCGPTAAAGVKIKITIIKLLALAASAFFARVGFG